MKKMLIVLGVIAAFFTATAFMTYEKTSIPQPGNSCKTVGNCTVELRQKSSDGEYWIYTYNKNPYPVTVSWKAYGYIDGRMDRVVVGSGQIYSEPARGTGNGYTGRADFSSTAKNVHLDNIYVSKCD